METIEKINGFEKNELLDIKDKIETIVLSKVDIRMLEFHDNIVHIVYVISDNMITAYEFNQLEKYFKNRDFVFSNISLYAGKICLSYKLKK